MAGAGVPTPTGRPLWYAETARKLLLTRAGRAALEANERDHDAAATRG
jgi:hypothetical protein